MHARGERVCSRLIGLDIDPRTPVHDARRRAAADGGDRQGAVAGRAHPGDGRADRGAVRARDRAAVRDHRGASSSRASRSSTSRTAWPRCSRSATASRCCATAARSRLDAAGRDHARRAGPADGRPPGRHDLCARILRSPGEVVLEVKGLASKTASPTSTSPCAPARSSACAAWSAPAAPRWRAPSSAPTRVTAGEIRLWPASRSRLRRSCRPQRGMALDARRTARRRASRSPLGAATTSCSPACAAVSVAACSSPGRAIAIAAR